MFHWHVLDKGILHVYIEPRASRLNGKVEPTPTTRCTSRPAPCCAASSDIDSLGRAY